MSNNFLTLSPRLDVTVVAVTWPKNEHGDDVEGCEIRGAHPERPYQLLSFYSEADAIQLPPGQYEIVGLLRDFQDTEELAILNVAIREAGGDPELNWLIIKKIQ